MAPNKREQRAAARAAGNGFSDLNVDDIPDTPLSEIDMGLFGGLGTATAGTGIVPATSPDGTIQIGKFKLTGKGLVADDDAAFDEWETLGGILHRLEGSIQWLIGDWLNYGARQWGDKYQSVADAIGYDEKTLRNYSWVARNIDLSLRKDKLSFGHHNLIAGKSEEEQAYWLNRAVDEKLSIAKLRKLMSGGEDALPSGGDPVIEETNRDLVQKLQKAKKLDKAQRNQIALMHEEFAKQLRSMR